MIRIRMIALSGLLLTGILSGLFPAERAARAQAPTSNQVPTFRANVNLVKVPVAVLDEQGRPVGGLGRADFLLYEDEVEQDIQQMIVNSEPVEAVLLLDISYSVHRQLSKIRKAALHFAKALGKQSRFSVVTFSDDVEVVRDWTSNLRSLSKALNKVSFGLRTSMYDGIYLAAEDQLKNIEGKKAIIMLTDGIDNESRVSFQQAADAVIRSQASVYVIGLTNIVQPEIEKIYRIQYVARALERLGEKDPIKKFFDEKRHDLESLSLTTGGRTFFPLSFDELDEAYAQVADELRSKAFLTYVSKNQDLSHSYRKIRVLCRRERTNVLYRAGYYVKAP